MSRPEPGSDGPGRAAEAGGQRSVSRLAPPRLGDWRELSTGVWVLSAEPATVNLAVVTGRDGAVVVDTGSSPTQGRELRAAVDLVTSVPVVAAVATHWHYDHAFGLAGFAELETIAHETVPGRIRHSTEAAQVGLQLGFPASELQAPTRSVVVAVALDLGGRRVEIVHLGDGHTDGDLVVVVPDADLVFAGDLLESAGPPSFGDDSFPLAWAATLDGVIGLMPGRSRAVPGHGDPVDREYAFHQRGRIAAVAAEITRLVESGVAEADALAAGSWPFPVEAVAAGVRRGYAELSGRGVRGTRPTLPLA